MRENLFKVLGAILLVIILFTSCSKVDYLSDIDEAFGLANEQNKKVFILVGSDGCRKCDKYVKSLNRTIIAKRVLQDDYICCKVQMKGSSGREFAMLMGAPFSPYSCFFTNKGELEAFRIGEHEFDFENIEKNRVDDYIFRELFGYSIGFADYKKQAFLAVQAWLCQKDGVLGKRDLPKSYDLIKESVQIFPNCGNLSLAYQLSQEINPSETLFYEDNIKSVFTQRDYYLYGDFCFENGIQINHSALQKSSLKNEEYELDKTQIKCGQLTLKSKYKFEFRIENKKQSPLIIETVRKGCGCIDVEWTKSPILPGEVGIIKGSVKGEKKGRFHRQLFVHLKSKKFPLKSLVLTGMVK